MDNKTENNNSNLTNFIDEKGSLINQVELSKKEIE